MSAKDATMSAKEATMSAKEATMSAKDATIYARGGTMSPMGRCSQICQAPPGLVSPLPAYCLPHGPLLPNLPGAPRPSVSPIIEPRAPKGASAISE